MSPSPPPERRTRAEVLAELEVKKLGYSFKPWRLVDPQGVELYRWAEYPGGGTLGLDGAPGGLPPIEEPVAFHRKRDAVAALAELRAEAAQAEAEEREIERQRLLDERRTQERRRVG